MKKIENKSQYVLNNIETLLENYSWEIIINKNDIIYLNTIQPFFSCNYCQV